VFFGVVAATRRALRRRTLQAAGTRGRRDALLASSLVFAAATREGTVVTAASPTRIAGTGGDAAACRPLHERVAWYAVLAAVAVVPIAMSNGSVKGAQRAVVATWDLFETVKVFLLALLLLPAAATWAAGVALRGSTVRTVPGGWLLAAFLACSAAATAASIHLPTALLGAYRRYEGLGAFLLYALTFVLVVQLARERRHLHQLVVTAAGAGVVVAAYGVAQALGIDPIEWGPELQDHGRAFSTYGSPVTLGAYLTLVLPLAVGLALTTEHRRARVACWFGALVIAAAIFATLTRGAWLGALVAIVTLGAGLARRHRRKSVAVVVATIVGTVAASAALLSSTSGLRIVERAAERATSLLQPTKGSSGTRIEIGKAAFNAIAERPLLGFGPDTFRLVFPRHKTAAYVREIGSLPVADNAHSHPIHIAVGAGIPAAVLLYAFFAVVAIRTARSAFAPTRSMEGHDDGVLMLAMWSACAGCLACLLVGISAPGSSFLLWVLLGALAARSSPRTERNVPRWASRTLMGAPLVAIAVLALGVRGLLADHHALRAHVLFDLRSRADAAHAAVRLHPYNAQYRTDLALVYRDAFAAAVRQRDAAHAAGRHPRPYLDVAVRAHADAEHGLHEAIRFSPWEIDNRIALASLYNMGGNAFADPALYEKAMSTARTALAMSPNAAAARYEIAWALAQTGRVADAIVQLEIAHRLDPGCVDCALGLAHLYAAEARDADARAVLDASLGRRPGHPALRRAMTTLDVRVHQNRQSEEPPTALRHSHR
jgi:putative inorganic carbon (HCO3(-)) transporter